MSDTLEIPLNAVKEWLDKETTSLVEPLRADAKKLLEDTQSKLEDLLETCDKLLDDAEKEIAKGSRKTYRRAKFLHKLAGKFADLIEEVTIPKEISGKSLNQTSEQIQKTLNESSSAPHLPVPIVRKIPLQKVNGRMIKAIIRSTDGK